MVASCTLAVPDSIAAVGPSLWEHLQGAYRPLEPLEKDAASPPGVYIGDSKLIHVEGWPLELERSALAMIEWMTGAAPRAVEDVLSIVAGEIDPSAPWLSPQLGRFPLFRPRPSLPLGSEAIELVDLSAHALSARQLNAAWDRTGNKAVLNWALVAMLIERALEIAEAPLEIVVDRQGGRVHYEDLLRELFGARVEVIEKVATRSAYAISDRPEIRSIEFLVAGDSRCAAISMASIAAKYIRELLMARLNDFFCSRIEGLAPTEGYFSDGKRFVRETAELRARLGIADEAFVRSR